MSTQPPEEYRDRSDIIADLERLSQEDGFIYTFCFLVIKHLRMPLDELKDWSQHLSIKELSFLVGLMVKQPMKLSVVPSQEVAREQDRKAFELLGELHDSFASRFSAELKELASVRDKPREFSQAYHLWLDNADRIVEPIFYGEDGAYDFQCIELAKKRYAKDNKWLETYVGTSLETILDIPERLKGLFEARLQGLRPSESFEDFCQQVLSVFIFSSDDIACKQKESVIGFLETFSCKPGAVNQELESVGAYNAVHSHPLIFLGDDRYFLPIFFNLAQSLYESPLHWVMSDATYKDTGLENRGEATERIALEMLRRVFKDQKAYRGVKVLKGNTVVSEIDVLAFAGNKAVIVQAKSKRLTELSRRGDTESIRRDFQQAVQDSFDQGLVCRAAVIKGGNTLKDCTGRIIELPEAIDDAYILCLTGDYYPAVIFQADQFLQKKESDPFPLAMSVFDLDILTFYLKDPLDFLYYVRQRTKNTGHFFADSEMSLLGFHLSNKLYPDRKGHGTFISPGYAQLIDANFPVAKGHHPRTEVTDLLFHKWRNEEFDQLVSALRKSGEPGFTDALFFLFDMAGKGADSLVRGIQVRRGTPLTSRQPVSLTFPSSDEDDKRGISFVYYPQTFTPIEEHFVCSAQAAKYKNKAEEWLALGSIEGSPELVDMFCYGKEPWRYDPELDRLAKSVLAIRRVRTLDGQKIGRNSPCPCNSGRKFKKCHGR